MSPYHRFKIEPVQLNTYEVERMSGPLRLLQNNWAVSQTANEYGTCAEDMGGIYLMCAIQKYAAERKESFINRFDGGELIGLS